MADNIVELTNDNFETEVLQSDLPVLVDFWAPWCMPCRAIMPIIEELAAENEGTAKIAKLNIDDGKQTALKYDVSSIPTLMVVKGGEVTHRWSGPQSKAVLQEALDGAKG